MSETGVDAIELVRTFMMALENNEKDEVEQHLADDFMFSGWTPKPLDKQGFLDVMGGIKAGIPGLIFNLHNVLEQEDNRVSGTWQVAGYQTDGFVLPPLGLPPIPQMGRSVSLPTEDVEYMLEGGRIKSIRVATTPGGGMQGLLHQLGVDVPIVQ